ncbi:ectoine/hydroxyectoine ABC transporter substrate-binding protein EhuB [Bradyrhizobium centrolobii]|uniref:Ectoine/hydroxyectoine ABC transporter substrate-binding protein EhuB n=1 Tax=Bradyrhizobium centrolobii TaxID=1505087 RepID=A0A176YNE7_9BRAD|nr:ectoine/hydroxyectoine ABC transporter substrate-binding protein EhuB [Bradyrhizobium centrolobii]
MENYRTGRRAVLADALSLALAAAVHHQSAAEALADRVRNNATITVGIYNVAPWGYKNEDGSISGIHPDLLRAVLGSLGISNIEFAIVEFPALIPSLVSRRIDIVATGMAITPVRCQQVIFTEPDLAIGDALVVLPGNPKNLHSYTDIANNPDLRIGGARGTTNVENAFKAGIPRERILQFDGGKSIIAALFAGRIDAIAWSVPTAINALKDPAVQGKVERALPFKGVVENGRESAFYTAMVFRPEDKELRDRYNESFATLKSTGTIKQIMAKYDFTDTELVPAGLTAKDLCGDNYR